MNPSFYVIYPSDDTIRLYINAIRVIAEENQRTQVHITMRGPYKKKLPKKKIEELSTIIKGEKILVIDVGNFFDSNQNTVFFTCAETSNLRKVWKKTTYTDFNPHLTIYDGDDNIYARRIYSLLKEQFVPYSFHIQELSWLEPKNKEKLELFHLKTIIDFEKVSSIIDFKLNTSTFQVLNKDERLKFIDILAKKLYGETNNRCQYTI